MNDLFTSLLGLLRLRAGPQDLPASWPLTAVMIAIYLGEGVLTSQQFDQADGASRVVLALAVILRFRGLPERFQQSLLGFVGTGVLLGLLYFLVQLQNDPGVAVQPFWALVVIGLFFWNIAVDANIYRHALSVTFSTGILITVGVFAVTYIVDYAMFFQP